MPSKRGGSIDNGLRIINELSRTSLEGHSRARRASVKMIERHYAKYIATALEDLARAAVVSLVPRSDGNVVPMGKRA